MYLLQHNTETFK